MAWSAGATRTGDGAWGIALRCAEVTGRSLATETGPPHRRHRQAHRLTRLVETLTATTTGGIALVGLYMWCRNLPATMLAQAIMDIPNVVITF